MAAGPGRFTVRTATAAYDCADPLPPPTLRALRVRRSLPAEVAAATLARGRGLSHLLARQAVARAVMAVPRTARFVGSILATGEVAERVAAPRLSVGLVTQAAVDEAVMAVASSPRRLPQPSDYHQVSAEVTTARRLFTERGWVDDPASYHRTPPPLGHAEPHLTRHWRPWGTYERLAFESGFQPRAEEPGAARWVGFGPNHTAHATVLRHPGGPRPWVVAVHGFCMGSPLTDLRGLHVRRLHRDLGMNVILPVLPLHGPRKVTRISGEPLLSFQFMNGVHGISQAIWDIRRLLGWVRAQEPTSVSIYGVSLGGNVSALVAGIEPGLDAVVAGIPVADFPTLFALHSPSDVRRRAVEHRILDGTVDTVYSVVSPLRFPAAVAHERRFIYAGYADRLARPEQARDLWEHWDRPAISWYPGNHVGYLLSRQVREFVGDALGQAAGSGPGPKEPAERH